MNRPMWLCLLVLAAFLVWLAVYAITGSVRDAQRQMEAVR